MAQSISLAPQVLVKVRMCLCVCTITRLCMHVQQRIENILKYFLILCGTLGTTNHTQ